MKKRQRKAYTTEEREAQIIAVFALELYDGNEGRLTTAMIANALRMTPSTHLRTILDGMVVSTTLVCEKVKDPGIAGFKRVYSLPDGNVLNQLEKARIGAGMQKERVIHVNARQMSFDLAVTQ